MPITPTVVTFPAGDLVAQANVQAVLDTARGPVVVTDRTPFHPVDHRWPDQGADAGVLVTEEGRLPVTDCVIVATDGEAVQVGAEITARRGDQGWVFAVGHLVADPAPAEGATVSLSVDEQPRAALSAGHTACHVASLALNAALSGSWSKPVPVDDLGSPDFDGQALTSSLITPFGATDRYRLGKSLRKKGFDVSSLDIGTVVAAVNERLAAWVAANAPVRIEMAGPLLTDLREWVCELPEGIARIACGGTHLINLGQLGAITVNLELGADELVMTTVAVPA